MHTHWPPGPHLLSATPAPPHAQPAGAPACFSCMFAASLKGSHDRTHPGRTGRSDTPVGSGRSAPRRPPGGTGSGLTRHTPPAPSLCSHTHTLCTNMRNVNYNHVFIKGPVLDASASTICWSLRAPCYRRRVRRTQRSQKSPRPSYSPRGGTDAEEIFFFKGC